MSNRTLLEFNHDQSHKIERDPAPFLSALGDLMRGGPSDHNLIVLGSYGVKWHGYPAICTCGTCEVVDEGCGCIWCDLGFTPNTGVHINARGTFTCTNTNKR